MRSWPGRRLAAWPAGRAPGLDKGLRRWRAVARSAARQSRRAHIPPVDGVLSTAASDPSGSAYEVAAGAMVLALHESATDLLADIPVAQAKSLILVVGPEGGIAPDEIAAFTGAGAVAVRLGPRCCGRRPRPRWRWERWACSPPGGTSYRPRARSCKRTIGKRS